MPINLQGSSKKLMCSDHSIAKMYCQGHVIYSSGNTVTYHVDTGITYQEEVDAGASCLSPSSFAVPEKSGYTFAGWSPESGGDALTALVMGAEPITLYAVWTRTSMNLFCLMSDSHISNNVFTLTMGFEDSHGSANTLRGTYNMPNVNVSGFSKLTMTVNVSYSDGNGWSGNKAWGTISVGSISKYTHNWSGEYLKNYSGSVNLTFDISGLTTIAPMINIYSVGSTNRLTVKISNAILS